MNTREKLVRHVQLLEQLERQRQEAVENLKIGFETAHQAGFDPGTLKVVLKLRRMTPEQRRERRALETIYLAALGMLEGDPLTDEARRRLDSQDAPKPPDKSDEPTLPGLTSPPPPAQPALVLKDPAEARKEGEDAAAAGKRIYDNPYAAGDPCRAAWDEGWCAQSKSHGMETPAAYQRRSAKPPDKDSKDPNPGDKKGDA